MWLPRLVSFLATAACSSGLYGIVYYVRAIGGVENGTWRLLIVFSMLALVIGAAIGLGCFLASFGLRQTSVGRFDFKKNWYGRQVRGFSGETKSFCGVGVCYLGFLFALCFLGGALFGVGLIFLEAYNDFHSASFYDELMQALWVIPPILMVFLIIGAMIGLVALVKRSESITRICPTRQNS